MDPLSVSLSPTQVRTMPNTSLTVPLGCSLGERTRGGVSMDCVVPEGLFLCHTMLLLVLCRAAKVSPSSLPPKEIALSSRFPGGRAVVPLPCALTLPAHSGSEPEDLSSQHSPPPLVSRLWGSHLIHHVAFLTLVPQPAAGWSHSPPLFSSRRCTWGPRGALFWKAIS